jgi:hypothetical protein
MGRFSNSIGDLGRSVMGFWRTAVVIGLVAASAGAIAQQRPQRPQRHHVTQEEREAARAALEAFTSPTLARFRDEAEFRRYVAAVRAAERTRGDHYYTYSSAAPGPLRFAQANVPGSAAVQTDATEQPCIPAPDQPCVEEGPAITVTGSRVAPPRNPSITNNQMRGVEEGDIIKQIDHFLLVLQDGRIFVIDIAARGTARQPARMLRLADRANVYRYAIPDSAHDTWYDELLVSGDRILVTGYSYESQATELAVFRLDTRTGRLRREGIFRIASDDYYSGGNYATRLIGDNLIVYTPIRIADIDDGEFAWPRVRRWAPEDDERERAWLARPRSEWRTPRPAAAVAGPSLLEGGDVYRPVEYFDEPTVHAVSVCPLASVGAGQLACRTTAMVGPEVREWYVTADHAYIWASGDGGNCPNADRLPPPTIADARRALIYRVPLAGSRPDLVAGRGAPPDQFAMQADDRNLYALVRLDRANCYMSYSDPAQLAFVTIPRSAFGATITELPQTGVVALPGTATPQVASRFTEQYVVYGGLSRFRRGLPDPNEFARYGLDDHSQRQFVSMRPSPAVVVPIAHPERARTLETGHTVIRADQLGDDIILTGYRDRDGLRVTLIDLDGTPRVASSVQLAGRYESEGRSHAFNSRLDPDGSSLMGLPTVPQAKDSRRETWRSRASDLSFLTADRNGRLRPAGELLRGFDYVDDYDEATRSEDPDGVPGYQCEVSCRDWYGNSRPVFTDGRIFGLSGTELIEGRMVGGRIREVRRLNIALSPPPSR